MMQISYLNLPMSQLANCDAYPAPLAALWLQFLVCPREQDSQPPLPAGPLLLGEPAWVRGRWTGVGKLHAGLQPLGLALLFSKWD